VRRQHLPPVGLHDVARVAPAAHFQVRRQQREEPQLGEHAGIRFDARLHEHTGLVRIGDDFLENAIAALGIGIGDTKTQRAWSQALMSIVQLAFVAEEGFPIADEILQVADLRPIDGRVVDLVQNAFGDRKPDTAQGRVSTSNAVLIAACPARIDPGIAGSPMGC
jgi:hypothetical protein